jgi:hypothetical protein
MIRQIKLPLSAVQKNGGMKSLWEFSIKTNAPATAISWPSFKENRLSGESAIPKKSRLFLRISNNRKSLWWH